MKAIVFDLGGVLIDWNPRHLYRKIIKDEGKMEWFLDNICTGKWNAEQDAGKPFAVATAERVAMFPEYKEWIEAYYGRWIETISGDIPGTVEILKRLKEMGKYKIYALSNWSHESYPLMEERYDFLKLFDGKVISGYEKIMKPDPEIYRRLLDRFSLEGDEAVFIDDSLPNILGAQKVGLHTIHFTSPEDLEKKLRMMQIMD